ncbi:MAG TPA: ATP-binding protein [Acidimicrobiales bacterium]
MTHVVGGFESQPWDDFTDALLRRATALFVSESRGPNDGLAGLRVTDEEAATLVEHPSAHLDAANDDVLRVLDSELAASRERMWKELEQPSLLSALAWLARLEADDVEVFAFLLGVELEPRRQRLLMYAQDNVTLSRPTLTTLRRIFPAPHNGALSVVEDGRLRRAALVDVGNEGPWATRIVSLPSSVTWAFVGDTSLDRDLPMGARMVPGVPRPVDEDEGLLLVSGADAETRRRQAIDRLNRPVLVTPCAREEHEWDALVREATMAGAGIILEVGEELPAVARRRVERADHIPWVISSTTDVPLDQLPARPWTELSLVDEPVPQDEIRELLGEEASGRRLDREQLRLVGLALDGGKPDPADAVRRLASGHLDRRATRIRPRRAWDDVVLPPEQLALVHALVERYRHRRTVYETWGFQPLPSAGQVALFSGPSGTGKTLTAEVVAGELGMDLYKLDLSSVVSKYIGETEQNLEAVFASAEAADVVLFFDEADSLLGKRSEVSDAHDRYANIEVSYLLQRFERYNGLVVLATNLEKNIDPAFTRRIHVAVEFPSPEAEQRLAIWNLSFPKDCPIEALDLDWLAETFEITGGSIRNVALSAAFAAAALDQSVTMERVLGALRHEMRKLGRLIDERTFTGYQQPKPRKATTKNRR